jgi:hypothetical protein
MVTPSLLVIGRRFVTVSRASAGNSVAWHLVDGKISANLAPVRLQSAERRLAGSCVSVYNSISARPDLPG